jgi:hypothetical protein
MLAFQQFSLFQTVRLAGCLALMSELCGGEGIYSCAE